MRVVRSHYKEWKIDTSRLGMLGFSGREVWMPFLLCQAKEIRNPLIPLTGNGRPDFIMQICPGPLFIPKPFRGIRRLLSSCCQ
jgi:hypothetical protein